MKVCPNCGEEKRSSEFAKHKNRKDGLSVWCRACNNVSSKLLYSRNIIEIRKKHKEYWENNKDRIKARRAELTSKARILLNTMKSNARKRGFPEPEWTLEDIEYILTNGRCEKTNIAFTLRNGTKANKNPFGASPDRIDNTKGYTKDNVQWVCWIYNQMKADYSEEDLATFVDALVKAELDRKDDVIKRRLGFKIV
jgi:hypothetical protein